jgi:hypothetical protein
MSYEIIYNAFSVRQGEAVIPYVISGSNNCTTIDYATGREHRVRDLTLAWWLADNEYRYNVEAIKPYALSINRAELNNEWKSGGIQGLSLNAVIKRIERIEIDNSEGLIKTQINSLYYFDKTAQEEELLNALIYEFNNGINRILLKAEREQYYNAFLNRIQDAGLKARLKEYTQEGRSFWHDTITSEYTLKQILNNYKVKKKAKEYDLAKISELMLLNGREPTLADANKHGFLKTDYSLIEGRIKLLEGSTKTLYGDMGFFPKGLKRRFKPISKGYLFLEVD